MGSSFSFTNACIYVKLYVERGEYSMERIDSPTNKKIKLVAKLHNGKYRKQENLFVAEGVRLAEMALESDWRIEFAFISDRVLENSRVVKLLNRMEEKGVAVYSMVDSVYNKAADTSNSQGVLLVMEPNLANLGDVLSGQGKNIFVVLDCVQDPGNAGTIIRTADAAGFDGVICLNGTVDVLSDKVVRSAMGSLFNIPVVMGCSADEFLSACHKGDIKLMVTALDQEARSHFTVDYNGRCAIVFGNEGNGASAEIIQSAGEKVFIPMAGKAESLNVSVAAAIVIYEAYRQRNF